MVGKHWDLERDSPNAQPGTKTSACAANKWLSLQRVALADGQHLSQAWEEETGSGTEPLHQLIEKWSLQCSWEGQAAPRASAIYP